MDRFERLGGIDEDGFERRWVRDMGTGLKDRVG